MSTSHRADHTSLLTLFQLIDSFFPTGGFAHSFGLETYVQQGLIHDRETFETYLRSSLHHGLRNTDGVTVALAHRADRIAQIADLDARLTALKVASEYRGGSVKIGRQFLRNARKFLNGHEILDAYDASIRSGKCLGHHAIAYGLVTKVASIQRTLSLLGYFHTYVVGQVSAAVRLIPLGATNGQIVIQAMQSDIIEMVEFAKEAEMEDLGSFTPGLDIRSMQHERLYSRLFVS